MLEPDHRVGATNHRMPATVLRLGGCGLARPGGSHRVVGLILRAWTNWTPSIHAISLSISGKDRGWITVDARLLFLSIRNARRWRFLCLVRYTTVHRGTVPPVQGRYSWCPSLANEGSAGHRKRRNRTIQLRRDLRRAKTLGCKTRKLVCRSVVASCLDSRTRGSLHLSGLSLYMCSISPFGGLPCRTTFNSK